MKNKAIFLLLMLFSCTVTAAKPNFVFLLVDDIGWGDLTSYGSKFHETPNIDSLGRDGMKFSQAYAACTVCSPSRAAILTGRYPGRTHLTDWIAGHNNSKAKLQIPKWKMYMDHERVTLPEALKEGGYNTAFIGKWHLMPNKDKERFSKHFPTAHGFDVNYGGREWGQPKGRGKYFHPFGMPNVEGKKGDYLTDVLTDKAVDFIDKQTAEKPFLLYFSYYVLHNPKIAKKPYIAKYKAKLAAGNYKQKNTSYAGMVQSLDESVGRVLAILKKKGFEKNTIVIFTGDNGGDSIHSSGGLRQRKGLAYEGGVREPLLIKWPGVVKAGTLCDKPVIGMDFYPTMLEVAGLPLKEGEHKDGLSLVALLKQEGILKRDALYWHYPHYHRTKPYGAVRYKDYKLIEFFEEGTLELYNLKTDAAESKNLAAELPEKTKELHGMLKKWRVDVKAQMPTANPNYR